MLIHVTVDSLEEGQAKLLVRPKETDILTWPVEYLPEGTGVGDILSVEINRDESETLEAENRVKSLLNRLIEKGQQ